MAPRLYRMNRRAAAAEATRLRVVEAAVALHAERGVVATKWADIAERADVALGTVYRYFPGYDELIPACTSHGMTVVRPPTVQVFGGIRSLRGRVSVLVKEMFGFYERAEPWLRHGECDRRKVPAVDAFHRRREARFEELVRAALGPLANHTHAVDAAVAFTSYPTWRSLHDRAVATVTAAALD